CFGYPDENPRGALCRRRFQLCRREHLKRSPLASTTLSPSLRVTARAARSRPRRDIEAIHYWWSRKPPSFVRVTRAAPVTSTAPTKVSTAPAFSTAPNRFSFVPSSAILIGTDE